MSDFDFDFARKQTLADIVRDLQERRGEPVSAASTLLRRPAAELAEMIGELCGDDYAIDADGQVQANPGEYSGPMEPPEGDANEVAGIAEPAEPPRPAPAQPAEPDPQPAGSAPQAPAAPGPEGSAAPGAGAVAAASTAAAAPPAEAPEPDDDQETNDPDVAAITQAVSSYLADASEESAIRLRDFVVSQVKGMARRPAAGRMSYPDAAVITVLADKNPRRPGTAAHARFAELASGMTVAEFVAAAGPKARGTLSRAVRQGLVKVG